MGRVQVLIKPCYYFINSYCFLLATVSHFFLPVYQYLWRNSKKYQCLTPQQKVNQTL